MQTEALFVDITLWARQLMTHSRRLDYAPE